MPQVSCGWSSSSSSDSVDSASASARRMRGREPHGACRHAASKLVSPPRSQRAHRRAVASLVRTRLWFVSQMAAWRLLCPLVSPKSPMRGEVGSRRRRRRHRAGRAAWRPGSHVSEAMIACDTARPETLETTAVCESATWRLECESLRATHAGYCVLSVAELWLLSLFNLAGS